MDTIAAYNLTWSNLVCTFDEKYDCIRWVEEFSFSFCHGIGANALPALGCLYSKSAIVATLPQIFQDKWCTYFVW